MDAVEFAPIAFNAWTYWAADEEFYVDTLDLSRIDEGVVAVFDRKPYVVSRGIRQVRDVVEFGGGFPVDVDRSVEWYAKDGRSSGLDFDVRVLTETFEDKVEVRLPPGYPPPDRLGLRSVPRDWTPPRWYPPKATLPWQDVAEEDAARSNAEPPITPDPNT